MQANHTNQVEDNKRKTKRMNYEAKYYTLAQITQQKSNIIC